MKGAKKRVLSFKGKEDGTYSSTTGEAVTFPQGYQFSFVRKEAFRQLSNKKWDDLTEFIMDDIGSEEYIGVYGGEAETSFVTQNFDEAMYYARMFNQESVLDWEQRSISDDWHDYLIRNFTYDESKEVDYDEIIKSLLSDGENI